MTRLVELPQVSGRSLWINPDHVVSVEHGREDSSWVTTPLGTRYNVDWTPDEVVDSFDSDCYPVLDLADDARAEIKENLER